MGTDTKALSIEVFFSKFRLQPSSAMGIHDEVTSLSNLAIIDASPFRRKAGLETHTLVEIDRLTLTRIL
jgi:hypothetical protein